MNTSSEAVRAAMGKGKSVDGTIPVVPITQAAGNWFAGEFLGFAKIESEKLGKTFDVARFAFLDGEIKLEGGQVVQFGAGEEVQVFQTGHLWYLLNLTDAKGRILSVRYLGKESATLKGKAVVVNQFQVKDITDALREANGAAA